MCRIGTPISLNEATASGSGDSGSGDIGSGDVSSKSNKPTNSSTTTTTTTSTTTLDTLDFDRLLINIRPTINDGSPITLLCPHHSPARSKRPKGYGNDYSNHK